MRVIAIGAAIANIISAALCLYAGIYFEALAWASSAWWAFVYSDSVKDH